MIRIVSLCTYFIFSMQANAQINNISISQKLSMHVAASDYNIDAAMILSNQAAAVKIKGLTYGIFAEKKYLMTELNQMVFFASKNYGKNTLTIIQDYNGFSESYCMQTSLGFSKFITNHSSLGVRFNYLFRHIKGISNAKSIGCEISLIHQLSKDLKTGLIIINPQSFFRKINYPFNENECFYKWGFLFDVSKQFYLFFDLMKSDREKISIVSGCSYNFNNRFDAMYSFSFQELSTRLSIGFNLNKMKIKLMSSFHPQLGYSPSVMFLSKFKENPASK